MKHILAHRSCAMGVRDLLAKQQNTKVELLTAEQLKLPEELRAITELRSLALPLPGISKCFRLTLTKERGEGRTVVHGYTDWLVEVQQYHERECKHAPPATHLEWPMPLHVTSVGRYQAASKATTTKSKASSAQAYVKKRKATKEELDEMDERESAIAAVAAVEVIAARALAGKRHIKRPRHLRTTEA